MKLRLRPLLLVLSLTLFAASRAPATAREEPDPKALERRLAALCARLEAERVKHHVPGMALAVVKDDRVVLAKGFGLRNFERKEPVTPKTLFAIGSATKAFTAALIQMLADEGTLSLDDPVRKHLPYFHLRDETADAQVALRDLLCHRTGLTRMGLLWAANKIGRREILEQVKEAELYRPFRTEFLYNNVMFLAAGEAAAAAAQGNWQALLKERIFEPLGMSRANASAAATKKDPAAAQGYAWNEDTGRHDPKPLRVLDAIAPAGAINANAEDMARWLRFLLARGEFEGKRLLSEAGLEECWTLQQEIAGGVGYGLGWMLRDWQGRKVAEHGGNIDGFAAQVGLIPDERLGYALLMNVTASPLQAGSLEIVWESMLGDPDATREAPAGKPWTEAEMQPYLGEYEIASLGVTATVRIEKKRLGIDVPGQRFYLLKWPDEKGLWAFDFPAPITVEFKEPVDGASPSLTIRQGARARLPRTSKAEPAKGGAAAPAAGKAWSEAQMAPLTGTYHLAQPAQDWKIQVLDGELAVLLPGQPPHPMHWPDEQGRWKIKVDPNQTLRFAREGDGAATAVDFERMVVTEAPRKQGEPAGGVTVEQLFENRIASGALAMPSPRWHVKGTAHFVHQGVRGSFEGWIDGPDRMASVMDFGRFGLIKKALDGGKGWTDSDFGPFEEATGIELEALRFEHPHLRFGDWRKAFERITVGESSTFEGEEVYAVRCTPRGAPPMTRYVSAKTGLVLKEDWYVVARGIGTVPIEVTFGDYRNVGGVPVPFRQVTESRQMGRVVVELASVEAVEAIPEDAFQPRK